MPLPALLLVALGAAPSPGLAAAFASDLQLTLGSDGSTAPPRQAGPPSDLEDEPTLPVPAARAPKKTAGSRDAAFGEAYVADLLLTALLGGMSFVAFYAGWLDLHPTCGTPDYTGGTTLLVVGGVLALLQPFAIALVTHAIFEGNGYRWGYWKTFGVAFLSALVGGALVAAMSLGSGPGSGGALAVGLTAALLVAPLGAPLANLLGSEPLTPSAPSHAVGAPIVRLAFD
ncbi:MAG: hypothetical protein ACYDCL_12335 [Myxococcales bacterium]